MNTDVVMCDYCNRPARLVTGAAIYPGRDDLAALKLWRCAPCDAHVGCHAAGAWVWIAGRKIVSDGTLPLGRLANAELRRAKSRAHAAFDPLWKSKRMARRSAYSWLARRLGIPVDDCHIGMMDAAGCNAVVEAAKGWTP